MSDSSELTLWPLLSDSVTTGGVSQVVAYGPMVGGFITNPQLAAVQGLPIEEIMYVSVVGPAGPGDPFSRVLQPGETYSFPRNLAGNVYVNTPSTGHRFSGVVYQSAANFVESESMFPPSGPTSLTSALPQYLYQQYQDDEDLLAFVTAFNEIVQSYMDFFVNTIIPYYPGLQGSFLDYVLTNLYGIVRPSLPSGTNQNLGALNSFVLNYLPLNEQDIIGPSEYYLTSDDVYKRIATWSLYTGDGKNFNIRWLKRRIKRFLTGENGIGGSTDETYDISVTFGPNGEININLQSIRRFATGGAMMNVGAMNSFVFNDFITESVSIPVSPLVPIFKAAVEAGVLPFPFQLTPVVNIDN